MESREKMREDKSFQRMKTNTRFAFRNFAKGQVGQSWKMVAEMKLRYMRAKFNKQKRRLQLTES